MRAFLCLPFGRASAVAAGQLWRRLNVWMGRGLEGWMAGRPDGWMAEGWGAPPKGLAGVLLSDTTSGCADPPTINQLDLYMYTCLLPSSGVA